MVKTGDIIQFTIPVRNNGYSNALNVRVPVVIPAGVEYYSSTPGVGTYNTVTNEWEVGGLQVGEGYTMLFSVKILDDCELPKTITWNAISDTFDFYTVNNENSYTITDSCCPSRYCFEFLKYKHVWIDLQFGNSEAQLENILKPFSTVTEAIAAINALSDENYKKNWHFHVSGNAEADVTFEDMNGKNIIEFENFWTDSKFTFDNIGAELTLKGDLYKTGAGYVFEFANSVNLDSVVLDIIIKRDTDDFAATQLGTPSGASIWVKSALIESNKPFGLPVFGTPIVFKTI